MSDVFSNHNVEINRKIEIKNRKLENSQMQKADSMLLNKEVKKEIKIILKQMEMEHNRQKLWEAAKAAPKGKFIKIVVVVQALSRSLLFESPWTAAHQAPLSFTISPGI